MRTAACSFAARTKARFIPSPVTRTKPEPAKAGNCTLNLPFPARTGMSDIGASFTDRLLPAIDKFKPDLILISAGFDSRIDDPLGQFRLTDDDFITLTKLLLESAATHCQNRLISVLEGGYNLKGLASAVTSHVGALL
jgi:acetoin utilization deacetylase AcuC-like enzyme